MKILPRYKLNTYEKEIYELLCISNQVCGFSAKENIETCNNLCKKGLIELTKLVTDEWGHITGYYKARTKI